ncbi:PAS domain S-box protein [Haladaptatus sp. YSMS36]|uniref:PAS domain S-box protein n=1 Tax=Haladaptatus sp. YSMS36 TaxID=3033384 RepID=UPI0023E8231E|nr:PAS domain S-box protein [Haladaptatus sp. YSMS36]
MLQNSHILYVTDAQAGADADAVRTHLAERRADAHVAVATVAEGKRMVEAGATDAVVTDFDGFANLSSACADLPVVVYASDPVPDAVEAAYDAGVTAVVERTEASGAILAATLDRVLSADGGEGSLDPANESHLDAIVESASDCIVTIDANSTIQFVNSVVETVFGYDPEALVGEPLTKLMSDSLAERHLGAIDRYLDTGERHFDWGYVELLGQHRDGHQIPLGVSFSEFERDGERYFTGVLRDITDRKRAERLRRRRKRQFDAVFNDPFTFFALLDRDGTVRNVNRPALDFADVDVADVAGKPFWECPWWSHSPELQSKLEAELERVKAGEYSKFEATHVSPAGETITVDFQARPVVDGDEVTGIVAEGLDITEQKRLQEELRHQHILNQRVIDTAPVGIVVIDESGNIEHINDRAVDIAGVSHDRLEGGASEFSFTDDEGNPIPEADLPFRTVLETGTTVYDVELGVIRPDGSRIWLSLNGSRLLANDGETVRGIFTFEDITDTKRRATRLEALTEKAQQLPEAKTATAVCETIVDAAADVLDLPYSYILRYEEAEGTLEPAAQTEGVAALVESPMLGDLGESPVWEVFIRDEATVLSGEDQRHPTASAIQSIGIFPLGEFGVFVTCSPDEDGLRETDLLLADMLCANARSSLARAAREGDLRRQRDTLERKNKHLARVNRINRAIRDITKVLIQAETKEEIESLVCEKLAAIDPFAFAWVGHQDLATDTITPVASAGDGDGYLDRVQIATDGSTTGGCPAGRALRSKQPQVLNNILTDVDAELWREEALSRGFRASIAVPLVYRDTVYGVLNLYSRKPLVFEQMELSVLTELGQSIGYAMNALERKRALVSERSVELDFVCGPLDSPLFGFADGSLGTFELENAVRRLDGNVHLFFDVRGIDPDDLRAHVTASPAVEQFALIAADDDGFRCECTVRDDTLVSSLADRGASLDHLCVTADTATLTVRIPQSADVRDIAAHLESTVGGVELRAKREFDTPVMTTQEFESEVRNRLTQRQEEVIKTAYFSGFFEWPRESNGQDVAEILGVTQPTINRHIRAGERALFGLLFSGDDPWKAE